MKRAFFLCVSLFTSFGLAEDLSTMEGQIEFLERVIRRYPGISSRNLLYRRNFLELLSHVPKLQQQSRGELGETALPKQSILLTQYYEGADAAPDPEKVHALKEEITRALAIKNKIRPLDLFETDLAKLKDRREIREFLKVAPFLYNETDGKPRDDVNERINNASAADLEQAFDMLTDSLWNRVKEPSAVALEGYNSFGNLFQKKLTNALVPVTSTGERKIRRAISIERVPASVGLFRFFCGKDCSIRSVPFHSMLRSAKVYFIYSSARATPEPVGYAFVVEAQHENKKLPYVLTINGTLNQEGTRTTLSLIAKDLGAKEIILPNLRKNPALVNGKTMQDNLSFTTSEDVVVKLSQEKAWKTLDQFSRENGRTQYDDHYEYQRLANGKLVGEKLLDLNRVITKTINNPYPQQVHSRSSALLDRALLGAQIIGDETPKEIRTKALKALNITQTQIEAARHLADTSVQNPLTAAQFQKAKEQLNFKFEQLELLDVTIRAATLRHLYDSNPELVVQTKWQALAKKTAKRLEEKVELLNNYSLDNTIQRIRLGKLLGEGLEKGLKKTAKLHSPTKMIGQIASLGYVDLLVPILATLPSSVQLDEQIRLAAQSGQLETVKLIQKSGLISERAMESCFLPAVSSGNVSLVKYLRAYRLELDSDALQMAMRNGPLELVKYFMKEERAKILADEIHLKEAIQAGQDEIVKLLFESGAKRPALDGLTIAIQMNQWSTFHLLRKLGANAKTEDLLHYTVSEEFGDRTRFLNFLLQDPEVTLRKKNELLAKAVERANKPAIKALVNAGANDFGEALRGFVMSDNVDSLAALFKLGANPHANNEALLRFAITQGRQKSVLYLFEKFFPLTENHRAVLAAIIAADDVELARTYVHKFRLDSEQLREYERIARKQKSRQMASWLFQTRTNKPATLKNRLWEFCLRAFLVR